MGLESNSGGQPGVQQHVLQVMTILYYIYELILHIHGDTILYVALCKFQLFPYSNMILEKSLSIMNIYCMTQYCLALIAGSEIRARF